MEKKMTKEFKKFTSIEQFHNIVKAAEKYPKLFPAEVTYQSKVKLHGTNAAIGVADGEAFAQKRTSIAKNGHYGFAEHVNELKPMFENFPDCYIYGEWIGAGIQKKVACSQLPTKRFCIYAIFIDPYYYVDPGCIQQFMCDNMKVTPMELRNKRIHIIDWSNYDAEKVRLHDREHCQKFVNCQEPIIQAVDQSDPWMKSEFDIEGIGEGLVYYPVSDSDYEARVEDAIEGERYTAPWLTDSLQDFGIHECVFTKLIFKAKGQSHERTSQEKKKAIQLSPEELASQNEYVLKFVTEERLHQIAKEHCNDDFDMRNIGTFLREFGIDVHKESKDELEASGMEWKKVQKPVQREARNWFIKNAKLISISH